MKRGIQMTWSSLEELVDQALVRVCSTDSQTLGSGFIVSTEGDVITCHHVICGLKTVQLCFSDGQTLSIDVNRQVTLLPDFDLAVIDSGKQWVRPLSVAFASPPQVSCWTKGYQFETFGITNAIGCNISVSGRTDARYVSVNRSYDLKGVWSLADSDIDHGLSGAPLMDSECWAVIGVIAAKLPEVNHTSGLALPLSLASNHLGHRILLSAELHAARYGRLLNYAGAVQLCKSQRDDTIGQLVQTKKYLPNLYVDRPQIHTRLAKFFRSNKQVFPIVGSSGVGKTMELAHLADTTDMVRGLLFRGVDVRSAETHLGEMATKVLSKVLLTSQACPPTSETLVKVFQGQGVKLCCMVDGLNEARITESDLAEIWIPNSVGWLMKHGAQLIISCRPEAWNKLSQAFPPEAVFSDEDVDPALQGSSDAGGKHSSGRITIGDYSPEEVKAATMLYGLDAGVTGCFYGHPFTLRILWEISGDCGTAINIPAHSLYEHWLQRKCETIAIALGSLFSRHRVSNCLKVISGITLKCGAYELPFDAFEQLVPDHKAVVNQLCSEHVLEEHSGGYRFAFDEIADYLQSMHISPKAVFECNDPANLVAGEAKVPLSSTVLAFLRESRHVGPSKTAKLLEQLGERVKDNRANPQTADHWFWLFLLFLSQVDHSPEIEATATSYIKSALDRFSAVCAVQLFREMKRSKWPADAQLRAIRGAVLYEDGYGWRSKDWQDPNRRKSYFERNFKGPYGFGSFLVNLIERTQDPRPLLKTLLGWLTDRTSLGLRQGGNSESSLGDLAAACLFQFRRHDFEWLCGELFSSVQIKFAWPILQTFAATDSLTLWQLCERWYGQGLNDDLIVNTAEYITRITENDTISPKSNYAFFRLVFDEDTSQSRRIIAARYLSRSAETLGMVKSFILEMFNSGVIDAFALTPLLEACFDETFNILSEMLGGCSKSDWAVPGSAWSIVNVLLERRDDYQLFRAVDLLLQTDTENYEAWKTIASKVEEALYNVIPDTESASRLLEIAKFVAKHPDATARRYLLFYTYGGPVSNQREGMQNEIRTIQESAESDQDNVALVVRNSLSLHKTVHEAMEWILPYVNNVDQEWLEAVVLDATFHGVEIELEHLLQLKKYWMNGPWSPIGPGRVFLDQCKELDCFEAAKIASDRFWSSTL